MDAFNGNLQQDPPFSVPVEQTSFTSMHIAIPSKATPTITLTARETKLKDFSPPSGFTIVPAPKKTKNRSVIYDYGVKVRGTGVNEGKSFWHCLASASCREVIKIKQNTSNASDHLTKLHSITSRRSEVVRNTRMEYRSKLTKERLHFLQMDALRYHQLNVAKFIIAMMLPFNFPESPEFRVFVKMLDQRNEFDTPLHSRTVKRLILELYLGTTGILKKDIREALEGSTIPKLHLNLDLWTSRTSHDKYVGIRIFFINGHWEMRSCLLAIRLFRPSKTISEQLMSDLLKLWCDKVLDEFGISGKDLYSSTSDSGSDVKRLCCTLLTSRWDWCISHMSNCALVEAFGTCLQAHKCKKPEFRAILKKVKSVIEHLHKSPKMRSKFEDMQFEETGRRLKLVTDMPHRWLGTIRVLERFLMLWKTLRRHYYQTEESAFPVDDDYQVLVECFSLAKPVGDLIILAQATDYPAAIDAFMGLCRLRKSVLADSAPLPIYDTTSENYSKGTPVSFRHTVALHDITVKTRRMQAQAFQKRFFEGYNGTCSAKGTQDPVWGEDQMGANVSTTRAFGTRWCWAVEEEEKEKKGKEKERW